MTIERFLNPKFVSVMAAWALLLGISPGKLSAMPTESLAVSQPTSQRDAQIEKIMHVLSHPQAQVQLRMAGIQPSELRRQLAQLDDTQLNMVAEKADAVKAGGYLGLLIGLVVLVILIVILIMLLDKDMDIKDRH